MIGFRVRRLQGARVILLQGDRVAGLQGDNFENPSDASYKNVNIIIYVIYYIETNQKGVILTVEVFLFSIKFLNHSDLE